MFKLFLILLALLFCFISCKCESIEDLKVKYLKKETSKLEKYLEIRKKNQIKYISKFDKKQNKFLLKLCMTKPDMADALNKSWSMSRERLNRDINNKSSQFNGSTNYYNSNIDTILCSMSYLDCDSSNQIVVEYKNQLRDERLVSEYMKEQKSLAKSVAKQVPELSKYYFPLSKSEYYFIQQNLEYDALISCKSNLESKVLGMLKNDTKFSNYLINNSVLSDLSKYPNCIEKNMDMLQTNSFVSKYQEYQLKNLDSAGIAKVVSNLIEGNATISKLKTYNRTASNDVIEFKPNELKTKRTKDRIKYGFDFQPVFGNEPFIPTSALIGLSIQYFIAPKISIGFGASTDISSDDFNVNATELADKLVMKLFSEYKLKKILAPVVSAEYRRSNVSVHENNLNFYSYDINYLAGLKLILPVGAKLKYTCSLLYTFNEAVTDPVVLRFGFEF